MSKAFAIQGKLQVIQHSVNIAEGTTELKVAFIIVPDTFESEDVIGLINFSTINYNDIASIAIESSELSTNQPISFARLATFPIVNNITAGSRMEQNFTLGATYVFRLIATNNLGQEMVLFNKSITVNLGNPTINCAKLNNIHRKACHNCFLKKWGGNNLKDAISITRVIELDVYAEDGLDNELSLNEWNVRHPPFTLHNRNNCGTGDKNFNFCLQDAINWHNNPTNRGHDPITIFIDLKRNAVGGNFWKGDHKPHHLDDLIRSVIPSAYIYSPKDLKGSASSLQDAAQLNNWPSMGDLKDKFIFILTGKNYILNEYLKQRTDNDMLAFVAPIIKNGEGTSPAFIWPSHRNRIVFYNMNNNEMNSGLTFTSPNNYISRVFKSTFSGAAGKYDNTEYSEAINFNMNNIAVANIVKTFNPNNGKSENDIQFILPVYFPSLVNNHILSTYQNVTQAAKQNIVATDLIVESGTHYRMIAGNNIKLKPGVRIKSGSDTKIRIDDCEGADYSLRQANANQLNQEEIDAIMHELNKELYGYTPEDENELIRLVIYPNPTSGKFIVEVGNVTSKNVIEIYDIMGKKIFNSILSENKYKLDITSQPKGIYWVKVIKDNEVLTQKIIYQ
jgi:hypothetical protein